VIERTDFVNIPVRDLERAKRFYGETLGLPRNPHTKEQFPEFETGNVTLLLLDTDYVGLEFSSHNAAIGLRVGDVDAARRELEAKGVEFDHDGTYDSGVCHTAWFRDPDGNSLALHRRYAPVES
jgi:catechol 2,3-dioxygenase-like lactoylglutathione lyase family enzyme